MEIRVYTRPDVQDYNVVIEPGALDRLGEHIARAVPAHRYAIIADGTVARTDGRRAADALGSAQLLEFLPGERSKNTATWEALTRQLIECGLSRDGCIVGLGGGVTTDLAGFVAATYMRGVPIVQVPTSLLAMIDAAIGGKTGVDTMAGKNLVGAFHQPALVLIDPHVLRTLPDPELRYGLAEAIKHGAIADAEYVSWIAASATSIFEHKTHTITSLITTSVNIKAHFVSEDVHEQGARAALNFGHTIAHALEHFTGYTLAHGDAVAIGMMVEAIAGELAGITATGTHAQLARALASVGLPHELPPLIDTNAVLRATRTDKKTRASEQRYTLLTRMGEVANAAGKWTQALPDDVVREALTRASTT
jgi:3-dehydroquinate synthase